MRVALCSDLHVDTWPEAPLPWSSFPPADVLIVAGDVHDSQAGTQAELAKAAEHYAHVVWVDGNHEAFEFGSALQESAPSCGALALPPNVTFLGARGTLLLRGTLFVGACAWFDYAFAAPECDPHACQQHFRHVALPQGWFAAIPAPPAPPIDLAVLAAAAADAAHVRAVVAAAQEDPSVERIVVVTHTVPHRQLLRKGLYPKALIEAGYYGCSAMEAVPEADVRRKIALWCFGHSHAGADARLAHIHYLSHPRGRPDDFAREQYAPRGVLLAEHAGPACAEEASAAGTTERAPLAVAANGL